MHGLKSALRAKKIFLGHVEYGTSSDTNLIVFSTKIDGKRPILMIINNQNS